MKKTINVMVSQETENRLLKLKKEKEQKTLDDVMNLLLDHFEKWKPGMPRLKKDR